MKQFLLRMVNLLLIVGILTFYQQKALVRWEAVSAHSEAAAQADALTKEYEKQLAEAKAAFEGVVLEAKGTAYQDGTYQGTAMGFGGEITTEVIVQGGILQRIEVLSHDGEDSAYFTAALEVVDRILEAQSAEVDTVSGATYSSSGIRDAVAQALEEAK